MRIRQIRAALSFVPPAAGSGANFIKCMFLVCEWSFSSFMQPRPRPKARERLPVFRLVSEVKLIFLNFRRQLNAADRHGCRLESLESEHRPDSLFDPAMVLFDNVVQVLGLSGVTEQKRQLSVARQWIS